MSKVELSPRLQALADMAEGGRVVADVGTDHGYVAAYLAQRGIEVTAADINEAPLQRARRTAMEHGVYDKLRFALADGLAFPDAPKCDTVIIAGMGGETIESILKAAPWTTERTLVLQPQTKLDELCLFLNGRGQSIERAALREDEGRLYVIMRVSAGDSGSLCAEDALLKTRDELLPAWLDRRLHNLESAISGMEKARSAVKAREQAERTRERLMTIKKECDKW